MKMTFEKLVSELKFNTGDGKLLIETDEKIEKDFPDLYKKLLEAYLKSIDCCVLTIKEMVTKVCINEELIALWFCMKLAVLRMYSEYEKREIDEKYFIAAMANAHRYINATKESVGKFGIIAERYVRALGHLIELRAFRIGDFNFEFIKFDSNVDYNGRIVKYGEPCLSVHVPIGTDISSENVDRNFALAKVFFENHFGMKEPICQLYSWLIHPSIKECLGSDSRLVKFAERFMIYEISNSPVSVIEYVFGVNCFKEYRLGNIGVESFPENTALQRAYKDRLLKGLALGTAKGITLL